MSSHDKGLPIQGDFCLDHLRFVMACSDDEIARCLAYLPPYDAARLRKIVSRAWKQAPEQREAG